MINDAETVFIAIWCVMEAVKQFAIVHGYGSDVGKGKTAANKIFKIIDSPDQTGGNLKPDIKGEIEFKDVWFRYPSRPDKWVLQGLSVKISAEEQVALVGESGCGKSTTVSLLLRFYDPERGAIFIDGHDIRDLDITHLRKSMGLIMQEPTLFNCSIKDNILYGNSDATSQDIFDSASTANALEFIQSSLVDKSEDDLDSDDDDTFPVGFRRKCGIKGGKLSGG